jgi:hypothetical protein
LNSRLSKQQPISPVRKQPPVSSSVHFSLQTEKIIFFSAKANSARCPAVF